MFAAIVGADGMASACITSNFAACTSPVALGVLLRGLHARRVEVEGNARAKPALCGGDREHAGTAAEVEHRALRLDLQEELEAELRRLVGAGPEGHAGVDDEVGHPSCGSSHGGRTCSLPPIVIGLWKSRQRSCSRRRSPQ